MNTAADSRVRGLETRIARLEALLRETLRLPMQRRALDAIVQKAVDTALLVASQKGTAPSTFAWKGLVAVDDITVTQGDESVAIGRSTYPGPGFYNVDTQDADGFGAGNYVRGASNGTYHVEERTPAQTLSDIGAAAADHDAEHVTGGGDKIRDATAAQDGLMTTAQASKLDGIEAAADVTDTINVNAAGAVMESDYTAKGDLLAGTGAGATGVRGIGTNGHVLTADSAEGTGMKWAAAAGGVSGPGSSTDEAIARWNGTGGDTLQDSGVTISDTGEVTVAGTAKIYFRDSGVFIHSNADGEMTIEADSKVSIGVAGDIELGDGTLRTCKPHTTEKINLGSAARRFNEVHCVSVKPKTAPTYTPTNVTTDRAFDADTVAVAELADVVGTLISDLQALGVLS